MKQSCWILCGAALLMLLFGCASLTPDGRYVGEVNKKLVSFTDCANAFSDSMEQMADSTKIPSAVQIDEAEIRMDALAEVCDEIAAMEAPDAYADKQAALRDAMKLYAQAMTQGRELLEFYRGFDAEIRSYPTPDEGIAAMREKGGTLYADFAGTMRQAAEAFRAAEKMMAED